MMKAGACIVRPGKVGRKLKGTPFFIDRHTCPYLPGSLSFFCGLASVQEAANTAFNSHLCSQFGNWALAMLILRGPWPVSTWCIYLLAAFQSDARCRLSLPCPFVPEQHLVRIKQVRLLWIDTGLV